MRKKRFMDYSICLCSQCGFRMTIPREHGNHRKNKHVKDLWCPSCKAEQKFIEIKNRDYYVNENGSIIY